MGPRRAEQQTPVSATPRACFEVLTDYESMAGWQSAVKRCEVLSRDPEGRGREVAWEIDAKVRPVRYTLSYSYEEPSWIAYRFLEGDLRHAEGEYTLEDRGDGTTLATHSLRLDPGIWVPGPLASFLSDQVMKRSLEELKRRVESLAGAGS